MKTHPFSNSLQLRIPAQLITILLPLIFLLVSMNIYSAQLVQEQASSLVKNTTSLLESQISATLSQIDRSLLNVGLGAFSSQTSTLSDSDTQTLSQMRARNALRAVIGTYSFLDGVFLYTPESGDITSYSMEYSSLPQKHDILNEIRTLSEQFLAGNMTTWTGIELHGKYYLVRILKLGEYQIGVWMQPQILFSYIWSAEIDSLDHIGFITTEGVPLFSGFPDFIQQFSNMQNTSGFSRYYSENTVYNTIFTPLRESNLSIVAFMQTSSILRGLPVLQNIFLCVTAILILLMPFLIFRIQARIVHPTMQIISAMQSLGKGDFSVRIHKKHTYDEFEKISTNFNLMADEIGTLKIAVYEGKLREQRTQLQFLQLQLEPHFFINALNVIYSLAQVSDFLTIQTMVQALTRYFRYALKKHDQMALLRDEIQHVQNYAEIQRMRYRDRLQIHIEIAPSMEYCRVPLFVLQTFVENSMKYAFKGEHAVQVLIHIYEDANPSFLNICIEDNGPGYPPKMLDGTASTQAGIGIENLRSRLSLLFHGQATLVLSNSSSGGAHTHIRLPYTTGGSDVSSSAC